MDTSNQWKFTTIRTPHDLDHPVSGTREFGYIQNANGSYTFYTQGVDRYTQLLSGELIAKFAAKARGGTNHFQDADDLWASFQAKVEQFVDSHGGSAAQGTPLKLRPDWEEVEEVLHGERPISDLGCH